MTLKGTDFSSGHFSADPPPLKSNENDVILSLRYI